MLTVETLSSSSLCLNSDPSPNGSRAQKQFIELELTRMVCLHLEQLSFPANLSSGRPELGMQLRHFILSATKACNLVRIRVSFAVKAWLWTCKLVVCKFLPHACILNRWKFLLDSCKHESVPPGICCVYTTLERGRGLFRHLFIACLSFHGCTYNVYPYLWLLVYAAPQ